jgi:hypothetical protein
MSESSASPSLSLSPPRSKGGKSGRGGKGGFRVSPVKAFALLLLLFFVALQLLTLYSRKASINMRRRDLPPRQGVVLWKGCQPSHCNPVTTSSPCHFKVLT